MARIPSNQLHLQQTREERMYSHVTFSSLSARQSGAIVLSVKENDGGACELGLMQVKQPNKPDTLQEMMYRHAIWSRAYMAELY